MKLAESGQAFGCQALVPFSNRISGGGALAMPFIAALAAGLLRGRGRPMPAELSNRTNAGARD
jgi:hypothetical protein